MSLRVLFISTGLGSGGAESALLRLTQRLGFRQAMCGVVSLEGEDAIVPTWRSNSVPVWCLGLREVTGWPSALSKLTQAVAAVRPTVIQGWMYHGNLVATLAVRYMRLAPALAWSVRQSLDAPSLDRTATRMVIRLGARLSRKADAIVYNSSLARRGHEAAGFYPSKGTVLPNGFDVDVLSRYDPTAIRAVRDELRVPPNVPLVGHVARWHPVKDHRTLLEAAARVIQHSRKTVFALVGKGLTDQNTELSHNLTRLGLRSNVRLLGERADVARLQSAFDVACLSSAAESFPNAIGEAMSAGVPCVSTAVGEAAAVIGDTGRIVPIGDVEALSVALLELICMEPSRRRELGNRARQRIIDDYSIDSVAGQYVSLYEGLGSVHTKCRP